MRAQTTRHGRPLGLTALVTPLLLAASALLLPLQGCNSDDDSGGGGTTSCPANFRQQVMELFNTARAAEGLPALRVDERLAAAAQLHSEWMASAQTMSHTGEGGSTPADRVSAQGYPIVTLAENVAAGQLSPQSVFNAWMNSPGHRANILGAGFVHVGVGYVAATGYYGAYWTANFGASADGGQFPPGGCHP